jgi:hypothetical protein
VNDFYGSLKWRWGYCPKVKAKLKKWFREHITTRLDIWYQKNMFTYMYNCNYCAVIPCNNYSLNLLQNCRISVLKIGKKVYAMWLLYQNKNYSYCSCNPFIDNAPNWRKWLAGEHSRMFECSSILKNPCYMLYCQVHVKCTSALDVFFLLNILPASTWGLWGYYILSISRPHKRILYPITITAKKGYVYSTQFIYSNRDVYIAIALCSSLLHSAIAI